MIERFNFYDVYGNLIPGAVLLSLLGLPHLLVKQVEFSSDFAAAAIAVVIAYVAGHLLQALADQIIPSKIDGRYPSDLLLDTDNDQFSADYKAKLIAAIRERFGVDASDPKNRGAAFLLCRNTLITSKATTYGEQFQGMYALMRGIAAASALGCAYDLGWLWSPFIAHRESRAAVLLALVLAALAVAYRIKAPPVLFSTALLLAVAAGGVFAAEGIARATGALSAAACVSLFAALWAFDAYRAFTWEWAMTVYRDFYLLPPAEAPERDEHEEQPARSDNVRSASRKRRSREEQADCCCG